VSGVAMLFGTMALILVLSVFNGLEGLVKSLYAVFYPDIAVSAVEGKTFEITPTLRDKLKSIHYIDAYSFTLEENALLEYSDRQHICTIKGVDKNYFNVVNKFDTFIVEGKKLLQQDSINYGIVGVGVAQKLGMDPARAFNPIALYIPKKTGASFSTLENAFNKSYVTPSGAFAVSDEFDSRYTFVPLDFFQQLTDNSGRASQIEIRLKNKIQSDAIIRQLQQLLGSSFIVKSRYEQNEVLYKVLKSEKWITFAILVLIMIIASFNIIGALSMLVLEKKKDIATLTALGIRQRSIIKIFLLEGMLMSLIGAAIGMLLALILCLLQQKIGLVPMPGTSFLVQYYPVKMLLSDFLAVGTIVVFISLFAAYLPARKAALSVEKEYLSYLS
jgi:lipoprotein-releasing system permease protein